MPENTSQTSKGAEESPSNDHFVLDFLYYDSRRIASYLSQFDPTGHLQSVTLGKSGSRGKKETATKKGKGGIPGLAEGTYAAATETGLDMTHGYERVFDPLWTNARTFLNHLNEDNLIERDLWSAKVGQFVLVTGWLNVLDIAMMKSAWQLPSVKNAVSKGVPNAAPPGATAAQKQAHKEAKENAQLILDLIQIMPHAVTATLITEQEKNPSLVWCALREEYLSTPASEIVAAHGGILQGLWSIVGVLNALPDYNSMAAMTNPQVPTTDVGVMDSAVGRVSAQLAPLVRIGLGRPANAHAITPLLIYRQIAGG